MIRWTTAALALCALAGCDDFEKATLTIGAPAIADADGASVYPISVCPATDALGDIELLLRASAGEWVVPDDPLQPGDITVRLSDETLIATDGGDRCVVEDWIVPDDLRTVRFRAVADGETLATTDTELRHARLDRLDMVPTPAFLAEDETSVIAIAAQGRVESPEGQMAIGVPMPTVGTRVTLDVQSDPPNAAAVNDRQIILPYDASRTLRAEPGTVSVSIVARDREGRAVGTLTLTRPTAP